MIASQPHPALNKALFAFLLSLFFGFNDALAQEHLKFYIKKEKDHYVQVHGSVQMWLRYTQMNPGSLVFDEERTSLADLSIRRYRLNFSGKASDKLKYFFVLGNNNINYYSLKNASPKILDAYIDYQVNEHFGFGIGKNGWTGLSRYASPAAGQPLAFDIDFTPIPLVTIYDDILRRFGIYVRGTINRLDYRFSLSKPAAFQPTPISPKAFQATFSNKRPPYQFSTYAKFQLFDKESQDTPWAPGSYLGKKEVVNIGAGVLYQPKTTWQLVENDTTYNAVTSFATDVFYDKPLSKDRAITFYGALIYHNLGRNFIRNMGINNPATGMAQNDLINGPGNSTPWSGTGSFFSFKMGYLKPVSANKTTLLQPYTSVVFGKLQALAEPVFIYNMGFNYYLNGQKSKISFGYENRPVFQRRENHSVETDRKSMYVLQYQFQF